MGYRSDIAYIMRFNSVQQRDAFVTLYSAKGVDECNAMGECRTDYEDPLITFHARDQKWYKNYADVQAHTKLYELANELMGAAYRFIGLGEDGVEDFEEADGRDENGGDTEYHFVEFYDAIHTVHTLEVNFPTE